MQVLVLGASGFLGLNTVDALVARRIVPRCGVRRRNVLALKKRGAPRVRVDLDDVASLEAAMAGCEVVVHAAGHYPRTSLDRKGTLSTGLRQTDHVLQAAFRTGVRRLVYLSSAATVAPALGPSTEADRHLAPPGHGVYHDLKWAMEERVLASAPLEVAVVCPGACLGPWDLRIGTSALLVALAHGMDPPHPDGWVNVVDARDVARAVVALVSHPSPPRRVLLAGGDHRLHELLVSLADRYRVPPPSPPLAAEDAVALADAEERAARGRPRIHREIVDLVIHGVRIDAVLAERALGLRWTPLSDTLDTFDAWARRLGLLPPEHP